MASESRRTGAGVIRDLFQSPHRFDFFQAVRLLEQLARERAGGGADRRRPVGLDDPAREIAFFRAQPSLGFPTSPISQAVSTPPGPGAPVDDPLPELVVTFFGLTGPNGVLPRHYTELIIQRIRDRDHSLRDFLDLFHHRLISLFVRAWEKYRLPIGFERSALDDPAGASDPVTQGLYCLVGLGTPGLRGRRDVADEIFLHYSGHFAHYPRSASALECLVEDDLGVPTRVLQNQGQWLDLSADDLSLMPGPDQPHGRNNLLGLNLVVGERVWDVQSKFRLRLGPLSWEQFRALMPDRTELRPLGELTRGFVGPELDFDVQPILKAAEVPPCRLDPHPENGPFLAWNTWVESPSRDQPAEDAVFEVMDL
jgi:type VI secretion system protein ImpH